MLLYGILMIIAAALVRRSGQKICKSAEEEQDVEIKQALLRAANKRDIISNILYAIGGIFIVGAMLLFATLL